MTAFFGRPVVLAASPNGQPVVFNGIAPGVPIDIKVTSLLALLVETAGGVQVFLVDTQTPAVESDAAMTIKVTSPTALQAKKADSTLVWVVDTTNNRVGIGIVPLKPLHVVDQILLSPSAAVGANKRGVQIGGANNGTTQFSWDLSANNYVSQEFDLTPSADGTTNPPTFPTPLVRWTAGGGMQLGAPTGGDKGANTLNVAGLIYQNGAVLDQPPKYGRPAQQVNATVTLVTQTVGAADGSFDVAANVNVTVSTTVTMTVTCAYTDENNAPQTLTMDFKSNAGTILATQITTALGNIVYSGYSHRIRAKAGTTITIATAGTVTAVTYTAEATITQVQ